MQETTTPDPGSALRQAWLSTLARAPRDLLCELAQAQVDRAGSQSFEWLREPETGLTMVRARIGGGGDRFNLGETTLTRCVVRHRDVDGTVAVGIGYVKGRDPERARRVAMIDALLQQPGHHARLVSAVIAPLRASIAAKNADDAARTAASRVQFFTLRPVEA